MARRLPARTLRLVMTLIMVVSMIGIVAVPVAADVTSITINSPTEVSPAYVLTTGPSQDATVDYNVSGAAGDVVAVTFWVDSGLDGYDDPGDVVGTDTVSIPAGGVLSNRTKQLVNLGLAEGSYPLKITAAATGQATPVEVEEIDAIKAEPVAAPVVSGAFVTSPNGGEIWYNEISQTITWDAAEVTVDTRGGDYTVDIDLYDVSAAATTSITTGLALADESYAWVPDVTPDTDYQIVLTVNDEFGQSDADSSDADFEIANVSAPVVSADFLTSPNGAETWSVGTAQDITWDEAEVTKDSHGIYTVDIELLDNGTPVQVIVTDVPLADQSYTWSVNAVPGTQYRVELTVKDQFANSADASDASDADFSIFALDTTAPEVMLPTFGDPYVTGSLDLIAAGWAVSDPESGIDSSALYYWNGSDWTEITTGFDAWDSSALADGSELLFKGEATNGVDVPKVETQLNGTGPVVDNSAPAGDTWTSPAAGLQAGAALQLDADVDDSHSGASIVYRYQYTTPDPDDDWVTLADDTLNTAAFSGSYTLAAVATNGVGMVYTSTLAIEVDTTAPMGVEGLVLGRPVGGEVWQAGVTEEVTWTTDLADDNSYTIEIEVYSDGTLWNSVATGEADDGSYNWTVAALSGDTCKIRIRAIDEVGNATAWDESGFFTIWSEDAVVPTVTVAADDPQTGDLDVTATATAGASGVKSVTFYYRPASMLTAESPWQGAAVDQVAPYEASWTVADGEYDVLAVVENGVGVTAMDQQDDVTVDSFFDIAITAPEDGLVLSGTEEIVAVESGTDRVAEVGFWYRPTGIVTWTNILTDSASAWTANWDTTGVDNGLYELKAMAVTGEPEISAESVVVEVRVFNNATAQDIMLYEGWNLISSPVIPNDTAIETVLADLIANDTVKMVTTFVGGGLMPTEMRWQPPAVTDLSTIEDGMGYWIRMSGQDMLTLEGVELPAPPAIPPSYEVMDGWNLIGFKSTVQMAAQDYLGGDVTPNLRAMYGYNAETGAYETILAATPLDPGAGYWLALSEGGIIYPPGSAS